MRWRSAGLAALAVLAACGIAAPAARACDAGTRVQAAHRGPVGGRAPLVIGDSTSIFAAPVLGRLGLEADAHGCRQFSQGVAMIAARRRAGTLPHVVVLALGANGSTGAGAIATAVRVTGPTRILGLVTPRNTPRATAAMRSAAARHPDRVLLIDWVRYSAPHEGWFAEDGLHVGQPGADAYARFIRRAVAPMAFPPLHALGVPRTAADSRRCGAVRRSGARVRVYIVRGRDRVTCRRARVLARRPPLRPVAGWRNYDWRATRDGPWSWVVARADHRVVIGTVAA